ncbi:LOW QUALITY PROTEIN: hypothetical protein IFM46972_04020 [Aspergillus udagawae]|uniref:Uncharacterized protein n=1 Tax=Aspergillus udagawae TaxID=91492 RepID=A0A8H3RQ59_9EURO|nr:LOW QUALITY PROTEIN: hypothetical protein IFM46972_04020 [Aspergillus udagawae]
MPSTGSGSVKALRYRIAAPRGAGVEGDSAHSMTASVLRWNETYYAEDAGMEMASGEAAWGRAMGNCDGQEEMFAREEGLEADTADIWKFVNHECTGAYGVAKGNLLAGEEATGVAEGGSHQTDPGVEEPSDGGTSID